MGSEKSSLLDDIFPKEKNTSSDGVGREKLRKFGKVSPLISFALIAFIMVFFGPIGIFVGVLCGMWLIGILFSAYVMKKSGRDPSAILALSVLRPLKVLVTFCIVVGVVLYIGHGFETKAVKREEKKIEEQVKKASIPLPKDTFFGFTLGETSFDEVVGIFKVQGVKFEVKSFKDTEIPSITGLDYRHNKTHIKKIRLEFDEEGNVYSVWASLHGEGESRMRQIYRAFEAKFESKGMNSEMFGGEFITPGKSLIEISCQGQKIEFTNGKKKVSVEKFRKKAQEEAAEKFFAEF